MDTEKFKDFLRKTSIRCNKLTLQIPEWNLTFSGGKNIAELDLEYKDYPEEWFMRAKHGRKVFGKEKGYLFLSRIGWEINKDTMKEVFLESINDKDQYRGHSWEDFVAYAENFFDEYDKATEKYKRKMQAKLDTY